MNGERQHPLLELLHTRHRHVKAMAEAWLAAGATSFGLWDGDIPLALWPADVQPGGDGLCASVTAHGQRLGDLRLSGQAGAAATARLTADAALLAELASVEDELNDMTLDLISSQDQLLALYNLTESTRSHLDMEAILLSVAQAGMRLLECEAAAALLIREPVPVIVHQPTALLSEWSLYSLLGMLQDSNSSLMFDETTFPLKDHGIRRVLLEPIWIRGQILAALCLMNRERPFNTPELKLIRAICDQAGAQLENALLYQETLSQERMRAELKLAQDVQLNLMPQTTPEAHGLEIAAGSLPALQVGGDFYDFMNLTDGALFVIGDVTGKGMPAAMLMAMTRAVIRSKARSLSEPTPANILGSVNDDMYDDFTQVNMFATVFVAQYDHRERVLYYANAGHSPVIYCPAGGTAQLLEADGTAVGVLPVSLCENQVVSFQPGDVMVMATDGFSEARNERGELFGYDLLLRLVEGAGEESAQSIAAALYSAVSAFSTGRPQDDDQTLIVLKGV